MKLKVACLLFVLASHLGGQPVYAQGVEPGSFIPPNGGGGRCDRVPDKIVAGPLDPGAPGSFDVRNVEYNLSVGGFFPDAFEESVPVEERAVVFYPRPLACGPFPVLLIMHGSHATCYNTDPESVAQVWPCPREDPFPIPNFRGYDYVAERLASHGFVVVSISANGINATNGTGDWDTARGELFQHHLDILNEMNTTNGPQLGGLLKGHLDLSRVGTIGHSRGGEGAVRHVQINLDQGAPYGLAGVFLIGATHSRPDFLVNDIPLAVLLPYCDGDQQDMGSTAYFDGARYNQAGDLAPKYSFEVMGANHNFYNTIWDPAFFPYGSSDDSGLSGIGDDLCVVGAVGNQRLTSGQQQGTLIAMANAFFRVHLRGESGFRKYITGDSMPPPSAMTDGIFAGYHPPDDSMARRDINRLDIAVDAVTNELMGAVTGDGVNGLQAMLCIPGSVEATQGCLYDSGNSVSTAQAPHALNDQGVNASQMRLTWLWQSQSMPVWTNTIPAGDDADFSAYRYVQFRALVDHQNPFNSGDRDLSLELVDGAGLRSSVRVSDHSRALFLPPSLDDPFLIPRAILNSVRVPLSAFDNIFLSDVREVNLVFDQNPEGGINVSDLMLADATNNLTPSVQCTVGIDVLQPNGNLFNVMLNVDADDPDSNGNLQTDIDVFSDQPDLDSEEPDAVLIGKQQLSLRGERDNTLGGRVYLVSTRAVDNDNAIGLGCCTVTVPQGDQTTAERAADALAQCTRFSASAEGLLPPPEGFFHILQ